MIEGFTLRSSTAITKGCLCYPAQVINVALSLRCPTVVTNDVFTPMVIREGVSPMQSRRSDKVFFPLCNPAGVTRDGLCYPAGVIREGFTPILSHMRDKGGFYPYIIPQG